MMDKIEKIFRGAITFAVRFPLATAIAVLIVLALPPFAWLLYKLVDFCGDLLNWSDSFRRKLKDAGNKLMEYRDKNPWLFWVVVAALFMAYPLMVPLALLYGALDAKKTETWANWHFELESPADANAPAGGSGTTQTQAGPLAPATETDWARQWFMFGF